MKKILLFALALSSAFLMNAQLQDCDIPGLSGVLRGFYEDGFVNTDGTGHVRAFPTEDGDAYYGLFWWEDDTEIIETSNRFETIRLGNRNGVQVVFSQVEEAFEPFGISFGNINDDVNTPQTIDLTGGAHVFVTIENKSDSTIKFKPAFQDVNGANADTKAAGAALDFANVWQEEIAIIVDPNSVETFALDFTGAVWADYSTSTINEVDFSQIKQMMFTVVNSSVNEAFQPLALDDIEIVISDIRVGQCLVGLGNKVEEASFSIFPNPSSNGVATFSSEVSNLSVLNASGNVVETAANATELNTSSLDAGLYILNSDQGSVKLVVE